MSENMAYEFIDAKEKFRLLGYELVGTKYINDEKIFLVKEKVFSVNSKFEEY